jgi:cell division protein FtsW
MSVSAVAMRAAGRGRLHVDGVVIGLVAALLLIGLAMVTSASVSLGAHDGNAFYFIERQFLSALVGVVGAAIALRVPTEAWERWSLVLLSVAVVLLVLVLVPGIGVSVNGSRRWLRLAGINFQVSEAARVVLLMYLCGYLVRREEEVRTTVLGFVKPLLVLGFAAGLLLLEPDFGSGVVMLATGIGLLFLAGVRLRHFLALCGGALALFALVAVSSPYRLRRLITFLDPWADPYNTGFQLTQSLIAIGRGEWFGVGLGASVQKLFYLPEAHTDFLFSVIGEEFGLIGALLVLSLFAVVGVRGFRIAVRHPDPFASLLAFGVTLSLVLQGVVNAGVVLGCLPTKGLALPFMSYGGSAMIAALAQVGVLAALAREAG